MAKARAMKLKETANWKHKMSNSLINRANGLGATLRAIGIEHCEGLEIGKSESRAPLSRAKAAFRRGILADKVHV